MKPIAPIRSAAATLVAALLVGCTAPQYDLVIRNAAVVDLDTGTTSIRNIGVAAGLIAAVDSVPMHGADEIDAAGLHAVPGLWDMHVHISDPVFLDLLVAAGIVGARDMGGDAPGPTDGCASITIDSLRRWRARIEAGETVGPRLVLAGPVATGNPGSGSLMATTPEEARRAVATIAARGADFVKVYERLPPEAFQALTDEARRRGLPVAGHVSEETLTIAEAIAEGQRSIEHVRAHLLVCFATDSAELDAFYAGDGWTAADRAWGARHRALCPGVWRRLREGGTWLTPTLAVERTQLAAAQAGFEDDPRRDRLPESIRRATAAFAREVRGRPAARQSEGSVWWATQLAFVARAAREGAPMLAGSDAACEGVIPGVGLHEQLGWMVAAGMTPLAALRSATIEPARYFGRPDRGRIAAGAEADLLLVRGNPAADVAVLAEPEALVLRGRLLRRAALDSLRLGLAAADPPA